jgi:hypothetical protein
MRIILSGYVYFKPLTKPQLAEARGTIVHLTPNKLYLADFKASGCVTIRDDNGSDIIVAMGIPSAHLGSVGRFYQATKRTMFRTLNGWTKLTVQSDAEANNG